MKSFRNWQIATKLYSVTGLLISMLLGLGLFGLYQASAINQRVINLYSQELVPLETVDDIKASFYRIRDRVSRHLLEPDRQQIHEKKISEQMARLARNETKYRSSRLSGEEKRLLTAYKNAWDEYIQLIQSKVLPLSRQGNTEAAENVLYGPALKAFREAREAINELADYQIDRAKRRYDNAQAAYTEMQYLTIWVIGFGMLLGGALCWRLVRSITKPVYEMQTVLQQMATGDLTNQVNYKSDDEIGQMATILNNSISNQREMISHVAHTVEELVSAGEEMSAIARQSSETVQQQRIETEQVATAMNEMTATVQEVAANVSHTADSALEAHEQTGEGSRVVKEAIEQINRLAKQIEESAQTISNVEQHSEAITAVLAVIRDVADQTNMLALNAAIEAARAGEHGRGFAVVADEVRTLAERTRKSTEEIKQMIEKLQVESQRAVEVMDNSRQLSQTAVEYAAQSGLALDTIAEAVNKIKDMSTQIASAAEEQRAVSEDINRNIMRINEIADHTAKAAEETSAASRDLTRMGAELQDLITQFTV